MLQAARAQAPGTQLSFIAFPGTAFSSPHHHTFFLKGNSPLTSRLLQPVLVDAKTAQVTAAPRLPWYLTALLVSQPLHFGDYGGLPMQIIWAVLDIATIIVLGSGLYLWLKKGNPAHERRPAARRRSAPQPAGRRYASEHRRACAPRARSPGRRCVVSARQHGAAPAQAQTVAPRSAFWRLWGWPLLLGALTAQGLVSALFSDGGVGDWLAWVALGIPAEGCLWWGWLRKA